MSYPNYLIHFNRQHDPKTGKFIFGDGDGDGISNDHAHKKKTVTSSSRNITFKEKPTSKTESKFTRVRTGQLKTVGNTNSKSESNFTRVGTGQLKTVGSKTESPFTHVVTGQLKTAGNINSKSESDFTHVGSGKLSSVPSDTITSGQTSVNHYLSAIGATTPINELVNDPRKHLELDETNPDYQWEQDYAKQEKTTLNDLGTEVWKKSFGKK